MTEPQIPLFRVSMPPRGELMPRLEQVLYSGMVGEGEEVRKFEQRFGDWLGGRPVLSFSSGTAALHTALMMTGVGPGDQVISNKAIGSDERQPLWRRTSIQRERNRRRAPTGREGPAISDRIRSWESDC